MITTTIETNGLRITTTAETMPNGFTMTTINTEVVDPANFELENDGQQTTFFCCSTPKRRP